MTTGRVEDWTQTVASGDRTHEPLLQNGLFIEAYNTLKELNQTTFSTGIRNSAQATLALTESQISSAQDTQPILPAIEITDHPTSAISLLRELGHRDKSGSAEIDRIEEQFIRDLTAGNVDALANLNIPADKRELFAARMNDLLRNKGIELYFPFDKDLNNDTSKIVLCRKPVDQAGKELPSDTKESLIISFNGDPIKGFVATKQKDGTWKTAQEEPKNVTGKMKDWLHCVVPALETAENIMADGHNKSNRSDTKLAELVQNAYKTFGETGCKQLILNLQQAHKISTEMSQKPFRDADLSLVPMEKGFKAVFSRPDAHKDNLVEGNYEVNVPIQDFKPMPGAGMEKPIKQGGPGAGGMGGAGFAPRPIRG
jgi:hypothetical protein